MGLSIDVFRRADPRWPDCTLGGISATHHGLVCVNVSGPSEPSDERPPCLLVTGQRGSVHVVPAVNVGTDEQPRWEKIPGWTMFGGNYATGDSRFSDKASELLGHRFYGAVAIHDRVETPEQYRQLSQ